MAKNYETPEEEMTVDIELEDGTTITCMVITIYPVGEQDYIAILPLNKKGEPDSDEVWIYRYAENPDNPDDEPILEYIEDEDEYENAADAFDEYLDSVEFDEINDED